MKKAKKKRKQKEKKEIKTVEETHRADYVQTQNPTTSVKVNTETKSKKTITT